MSLKAPKTGLVLLAIAVISSVALFLFFLNRFGGPAVRLGDTYTVVANFPDTRGLAPRSEVLVRGVHVGEVESIAAGQGTSRVRLTIDSEYAPLHRGTTVGVGQKTLFGEGYVDLLPGDAGGSELSSGTVLAPDAVLDPTPDVDQALDVLDAEGRRRLIGLIETFGESARDPESLGRVNAAFAEMARVTRELRELTDALAGQEGAITGGVSDGRTVLATLGQQEAALRQIVTDGRATLSESAANSENLRAGLRELPLLLASAERTLDHARPLLEEAQPLARDLTRAAGPLNDALVALPPSIADANTLIAALPDLTRVGPPFLRNASRTLSAVRPALPGLEDAVRNLVAPSRFLSARRHAFAAWFSNTGDLGSHRDSKGYFARFFLAFEPGQTMGVPSSLQTNAYTGPRDAAANRPYSGYPRLMPFRPPSMRNEGDGE